VNTLFTGFIAMLALALGLAFGLGGRETAGRIVQEWYERGRAAPRVKRAAEREAREAQAAAAARMTDGDSVPL